MKNIDKMIRVGITHGDINGIGYELIFKTFAEMETLEVFTPIIYGSLKAASVYEKLLDSNCRLNIIKSASEATDNRINFIEVCDDKLDVKPGTPSTSATAAASRAIGRAISDYVEGLFDALVTAPASETDIPSIIEKLKQLPNVQAHTLMPISIYGNDVIRVASVAGKVDEKKAISIVTEEDIVERATALRNALRRDLRLDNPRIAILSFDDNDKEAEQQHINTVILPAVKRLNDAHIPTYGAYKADDIFDNNDFLHFDGILGMYDSQVITPLSKLYHDNCVCITSGLPLVICAPVQGPCYDIAGKGIADESSMRLALYNAVDISRSRFYYDQPFANPLQKLYHEHREDGDKARFSVRKPFPKKGELPPITAAEPKKD